MHNQPAHADASSTGIAECLRLLAEEAASLNLVRTVMALLETLEICKLEAQTMPAAASGRAPPAEAIEPACLIVH